MSDLLADWPTIKVKSQATAWLGCFAGKKQGCGPPARIHTQQQELESSCDTAEDLCKGWEKPYCKPQWGSTCLEYKIIHPENNPRVWDPFEATLVPRSMDEVTIQPKGGRRPQLPWQMLEAGMKQLGVTLAYSCG